MTSLPDLGGISFLGVFKDLSNLVDPELVSEPQDSLSSLRPVRTGILGRAEHPGTPGDQGSPGDHGTVSSVTPRYHLSD